MSADEADWNWRKGENFRVDLVRAASSSKSMWIHNSNYLALWLSSLYALICTLELVASVSEDELAVWLEYKAQFNKSYSSPEEELRRQQIFIDNKRFIDSHNTKSQNSFKQGINPLSDLTTEEINASRNGFRLEIEPDDEQREGFLEALLSALTETSHNLEDDVVDGRVSRRAWYEELLTKTRLDYREYGRVSRVKDQGSCGSCWAFATTGAIESILAGRNRSILLSEQDLVDCSRHYDNHGCSGGLMDAALRYVRDHGIMAARDYPYQGKEGQCRHKRDRVVTRVRGSMMLPRGNEAVLRVALSLTGPIPVAIDASARSFHSYKSGVYNDRACRSSIRTLNHAVLLVGYGSERNGGDYWILKNSWGRGWGDNGYIRVARNRGNLCGVASYAVLPLR